MDREQRIALLKEVRFGEGIAESLRATLENSSFSSMSADYRLRAGLIQSPLTEPALYEAAKKILESQNARFLRENGSNSGFFDLRGEMVFTNVTSDNPYTCAFVSLVFARPPSA